MKGHRQRGEGPLSCAENQPSTTRQREQREVSSLFFVGTNPSTTMKEHKQKGEGPLSCADNKASTTRQQAWRSESSSSSSSEEDEPSTMRRQQQQSPVSFIEINLSTTFSQDGRSGGSPSSTSSSYEDDEPANSFLSIHLSARGNLGDARQNEATERVKRERERCEKMKKKHEEQERKTFGLLSRIYIWWLNRKIDRIAREVQSTVVDERNLLRHGHLSNSKKISEKERLLDRRTKLVVYKHRQEFKVEREMRQQRLKIKRKEEKVLKMANISELCDNPEMPTPDRRSLKLYSI
ncbi:uncharacterized protein LOC116690418 [Etheostoma spectabile]|uniref:uncharacterized protein LOC116690418 n=1 Tax=Etheostoma spectabile TaxID=54343 RepID=UPI0013AF9D7F|nr:uncharacterized protein LOC116690418 [Etheostoma spectabile]